MMRPFNGVEVDALFPHFPKGTHFPELQDGVANCVDRVVDLLFSGETAQSETKRTVCQVIPQTEGLEDLAGLQ